MNPDQPAPDRGYRVALILGGGNALGSYQAGVYQALHERGMMPDQVVGTSAGAVNGAVIAGNAPEDRLDRLHALWRPGVTPPGNSWWAGPSEDMRRTAAVTATIAGGRRGVFSPPGPLGSWWLPDWSSGTTGIFGTGEMAATLPTLLDFERLNTGPVDFRALAVDLESGEDVVFDNRVAPIAPDHVRASASLIPAFPPVEVDGRMLVDGGFSANLPIDLVLDAPAPGTTLCIAADLFPVVAPQPRTLGEAAGRMQDLMFGVQSRRAIAHWQARYDLSAARADAQGAPAAVTLVRLAYADQQQEVAGKVLDFSPASAAARWESGHRDACAMLDQLEAGQITLGTPGLRVYNG